MTETTSIVLLVKCQSLFRAFVVTDSLPQAKPEWIEQVNVPANLDSTVVRAWLGRGPISVALGTKPTIYFAGGGETYPVFNVPGISPAGASVRLSNSTPHVEVDAASAFFCLEAVASVPVAPHFWEQVTKSESGADLEVIVQAVRARTRAALDTIVGAYTLYQYPLVWAPLHERDNHFFLNLSLMKTSRSQQLMRLGNFVPLKLDASTRVKTEGIFSDAVLTKAAAIVESAFSVPLLFLRDSLWSADIRTRFLLQFWIIEFIAEKHAETVPPNKELRGFVDALEAVVAERFSAYVQHFKIHKGELVRQTLVEKVQACCLALGVSFPADDFRLAKKTRDSLSHGAEYAESDLVNAELFIREFSRNMLRLELERNGVVLFEDPSDKTT